MSISALGEFDDNDEVPEFNTEKEISETGLKFIEELKKNEKKSFVKMINQTDDWYFSDKDYITNSHLKIVKEGGIERYIAFKKGLLPQRKSPALDFGSALHCLILEPERFEKQFYVMDDTDICNKIGGAMPRGTKAYKEWKAEELVKLGSRQLLTQESLTIALAMAEKVHSIPECVDMIRDCLYEKIFTSEWNGVKTKGKIDMKHIGHEFFADIKTTRFPAIKENFEWEFRKNGYARQMGFYANLLGIKSAWIIAIEKTYPYSVGLFEISEQTLALGYQEAEKELMKIKNLHDDPELALRKLTFGTL